MSNILIIKHGSLGDIAQASGAIQDIFENHKDDQIYFLTTKPYFELFKKNPYINEVILDKRLPKYNLVNLYFLMRELKKHKFSRIFDLQNSSRTNFYKNILFPKAGNEIWSSTLTTLPSDKNKDEFDKNSVLERFDYQLRQSGLNTSNTLKPDFSWPITDISEIRNFYKINIEACRRKFRKYLGKYLGAVYNNRTVTPQTLLYQERYTPHVFHNTANHSHLK